MCKIAQKGSLIFLQIAFVERHRKDFFSLIENYVDILFGNIQEIEALLNGQPRSIVEITVVTNEKEQIFKANGSTFISIDGLDVLIQLDLFAADFVWIFKIKLEECEKLATKCFTHNTAI